jgi:hypothetical protein
LKLIEDPSEQNYYTLLAFQAIAVHVDRWERFLYTCDISSGVRLANLDIVPFQNAIRLRSFGSSVSDLLEVEERVLSNIGQAPHLSEFAWRFSCLTEIPPSASQFPWRNIHDLDLTGTVNHLGHVIQKCTSVISARLDGGFYYKSFNRKMPTALLPSLKSLSLTCHKFGISFLGKPECPNLEVLSIKINTSGDNFNGFIAGNDVGRGFWEVLFGRLGSNHSLRIVHLDDGAGVVNQVLLREFFTKNPMLLEDLHELKLSLSLRDRETIETVRRTLKRVKNNPMAEQKKDCDGKQSFVQVGWTRGDKLEKFLESRPYLKELN